MTKFLYVWNWVGGGWNQIYARNRADALAKIKTAFRSIDLRVDMSTFRKLNRSEEAGYWRTMFCD